MLGARAAVWWLVLFLLWWLIVGSWSVGYAVGGAAAATLVTVAALAAGEPARGTTSRGLGWLRELGSAAVQVALDFAVLVDVLARAVARRDRGPTGRTLVRETGARGPDAAVRRGWVTLVATWSPNAYVIGIDEPSGRATLHDLRPWRRSEEPV